MSAEELMDLFQRPLYDIQRAWRAPLFRIVQRLSQGILQGSPEDEERCTLAFLILPGLVAECHYGKWIPVAGLLSHLEQGIDRVCSDEEFVTLVLRQAGQVVPRIKAYRERVDEANRLSRPMDLSGLESLRRNIERLIRERRLGLANKLLDRYQLALRSGSFESDPGLGLEEIQTQVASLFPPAGDEDRFSDAQFDLARETPPHLS